MTKFKVGDQVRCISGYTGYAKGSEYNLPRTQGTVIQSGNGYITVSYGGKESPAVNSSSFELVSPSTEEMIKLLTDSGYTIVSPKPKLTGKAYVYHYPEKRDGQVYIYNDDLWDKYVTNGSGGAEGKVLLAVVDWKEGDGLPNPDPFIAAMY